MKQHTSRNSLMNRTQTTSKKAKEPVQIVVTFEAMQRFSAKASQVRLTAATKGKKFDSLLAHTPAGSVVIDKLPRDKGDTQLYRAHGSQLNAIGGKIAMFNAVAEYAAMA